MKKWLILLCLIFLVPSVAQAFTPTQSDIYWLTQNIYHEARGESNYGKILVGFVTLQRLANGKWGNTVKKVVTSKHQFSWYWDGKSDIPKDEESWNICRQMAIISVAINEIVGYQGIIYYHDSKVNPKWRYALDQLFVVGNHIVYKEVD